MVDESHHGQDQDGSVNKILRVLTGIDELESDLMDYKKWQQTEKYILSISATPLSEMINKSKNDEKFDIGTAKLQPGDSYYGIKNFYDDGMINNSMRLQNYNNAEKFVRENENIIKQNKFMIIRLPSRIAIEDKITGNIVNPRKNMKKNINDAIKNILNIQPKIYIYACKDSDVSDDDSVDEKIEFGYDLNVLIQKQPEKLSIIYVINKLLAGVRLENTNNISLIHDSALKSDVAAQSLCGRCCGYNKNRNIKIFTNMKEIKKYIEWVDKEFAYENVPNTGKNVKSNNQTTGNEMFNKVKTQEEIQLLKNQEKKEFLIENQVNDVETKEQRDARLQAKFRE